MGTITSGVGLISGINTQDLITKLMAIEAQPLALLKTRINTTTQIKTAYTALAAQFLLAKTAAADLGKLDTFNARTATSSNEKVLTATASANGALNSYTFQVNSLVTTNQIVSAGFASTSAQVGAGTLTFETGQSAVDQTTLLSDLNGQQGVRRGMIHITDRSGTSANVDLRFATTVQDILDAINGQSGIQVRAAIQGDRLVLSDRTGLSSGSLIVSDIGQGSTAADLGLAGTGTTQITGKDLVRLVDSTQLSRLNDGNGVRTNGFSDDLQFTLHDGRQLNVNLSGVLRFDTNFTQLNDGNGVRSGTIRITNRAGATRDIDLSSATTLQNVVDAINGSGISVTASLSSSSISINDSSGGTASNFKIEDLSGHAAADLGITANVSANGIVGSSIYRVDTLGAVIRAIENSAGNNGALTAAISADGDHLVFTDTTIGIDPTSVQQVNGSHAAEDLGLTGDLSSGSLTTRRLLSGLNTVLLNTLNGGSGIDTSALNIERLTQSGTTTESIDLSNAQTLQDVVDAINNHVDGLGQAMFQARVSEGGTGLVIEDAGDGQITNVSGATAGSLHLEVSQDGTVVGGDLQRRYISENTTLASLNSGRGVAQSKFKISGTDGRSATITLTASDKTLGNVIQQINATNIGITARINDSGDGILLTDTNAGAGKLIVEENGSSTAADLGILKAATGATLDGSFGRTVDVSGNDTLDSLVTKINAANAGVKASIISDGSSVAPYRLILTSTTSGAAGNINFNTGSTRLAFSTLTAGQDAKLVIGDPNSPNSVVVTSGSNTVKNVVGGLTLQLNSPSTEAVQVTVAPDVETVVTNINSFITTINSGFDKIDQLTSYNADTQQAGLLLGDSTVTNAKDRLISLFSSTLKGQGLSITSLTQLGITIGGGAQLQFDEAKFREAYADDPDTIQKLFTLTSTDTEGKTTKLGFGSRLAQVLDDLTQTGTGLLTAQADKTQDKIDLYNKRVEDMQKLLDSRQARLTKQFNAMETALASLQGQQSALSALSSLASSATLSGNSA